VNAHIVKKILHLQNLELLFILIVVKKTQIEKFIQGIRDIQLDIKHGIKD
jgi:hypothetical protein